MEIDILWKLLDSIQSQIKSFDTKAQVAIGLDGFLAGLLGAELTKSADYAAAGMHWRFTLLIIAATFSLLMAALSFFFALRTIHPQLHLEQPKSHFFFCHLVEKYGRQYRKAAAALSDLSDQAVRTEIGTQILTNSIICDAKANRCKRALFISGVALVSYLMTLYPLCSMALEMATRKH